VRGKTAENTMLTAIRVFAMIRVRGNSNTRKISALTTNIAAQNAVITLFTVRNSLSLQ